jgi:very-short-patch-repair endonuclease
MQFYPEKMLPLRIPEAHERLDPPLIDIYVPHGTRGARQKINRVEADVIVEEIVALTERADMRDRTIGVISLVGAEQADHIRSRLSETIGEEIMQRHAILCGDSATFQGSERDVMFLSMVADSANKAALTMRRYEQRFNVAVSRARDRVVLVRSVKREELNPNDLKARLIAHFENPMPEREAVEDVLAVCESNFERDLMRKLLDRSYRVQGQVGSIGYRIDMVVEGADGRRLAVECDGDRFHGPQQWRQDMRRQRVLERVGWRFWRCFASSFYRNPDVVMNDLFETLGRMGIEPVGKSEARQPNRRFTEHRIIQPASNAGTEAPEMDGATVGRATESVRAPAARQIELGDKVVLMFSDEQKRISARLLEGATDLDKGHLGIASPLGLAILGAEEGDEIELPLKNGEQRKVLIESVAKATAAGAAAISAFDNADKRSAVA